MLFYMSFILLYFANGYSIIQCFSLYLSTNKMEGASRLLECPVCMDVYNSTTNLPKCLPCLHNMCLVCLVGLHKDQQIICPICRTVHQVTDPNQVKVNPLLMGLLDEHHHQLSVQDQSDIQRQIEADMDDVDDLVITFTQMLTETNKKAKSIRHSTKRAKDKIINHMDLLVNKLYERRDLLLAETSSKSAEIIKQSISESEAQLGEAKCLKDQAGSLLESSKIDASQLKSFKGEQSRLAKLAESCTQPDPSIDVSFSGTMLSDISRLGDITVTNVNQVSGI
jgi:hypothetical protein